MMTPLTKTTLQTAAAFKIRLSWQQGQYILRSGGKRIPLDQKFADSLMSAVIRDVQAEGARYDDNGPSKYGVSEWVADFLSNQLQDYASADFLSKHHCQKCERTADQCDCFGSDTQVDSIIQLRNRAARVGSDDGWSASDEDAAWALMNNGGN